MSSNTSTLLTLPTILSLNRVPIRITPIIRDVLPRFTRTNFRNHHSRNPKLQCYIHTPANGLADENDRLTIELSTDTAGGFSAFGYSISMILFGRPIERVRAFDAPRMIAGMTCL